MRAVSSTQAEIAVMQSVAAHFDDVAQTLQTMLSRLIGEVESVRQDWQGRGGTSFEQVSLAWAGDQARLLTALAETATAIRAAGTGYTATDDAASARLSVPSSLPPTSLPL
jgi:WXG100 family type VII secretion target